MRVEKLFGLKIKNWNKWWNWNYVISAVNWVNWPMLFSAYAHTVDSFALFQLRSWSTLVYLITHWLNYSAAWGKSNLSPFSTPSNLKTHIRGSKKFTKFWYWVMQSHLNIQSMDFWLSFFISTASFLLFRLRWTESSHKRLMNRQN